MREKFLPLVMIYILLLTSCAQLNTLKDTAIENAAKTGAKAIEIGATCSNPENIEKYLLMKVASLEWLKYEYQQKGIVGDMCKNAFSAMVPTFIDKYTGKLPEDWGCTGQLAKDFSVTFSAGICEKIKY